MALVDMIIFSDIRHLVAPATWNLITPTPNSPFLKIHLENMFAGPRHERLHRYLGMFSTEPCIILHTAPCCCIAEMRSRLNHSWWLLPGHYHWLEPSHAFENFREYEVGLLALSFLQGSFAYGGWNFLNYVTEELVDPCR